MWYPGYQDQSAHCKRWLDVKKSEDLLCNDVKVGTAHTKKCKGDTDVEDYL